MKRESLNQLATKRLLQRYAENGVEQDEAIFNDQNQKFKRLYWEMDAIEKELALRDQRRLLMQFYDHRNLQVRLNAANLDRGVFKPE